jgi:hypothetical protein
MSNPDTEQYIFTEAEVPGGVRYEAVQRISRDRIPFMMALDLLARGDSDFVRTFLEVLKQRATFKAYFFETPPMTEIKVCGFVFLEKILLIF